MEARSIIGLDYVKEVGKHVVTDVLLPPLKRHFHYWWSFPDNMQSLRDEVRQLKRARRDMDQNIEEARYRAESATTGVRDWSDEGSQKLEEADRILQGCNEIKPWNIIRRYDVGKSAKNTADGIVKLRNKVESIRISYLPLPPSMSAIPHEPTMEFESRRRLEEDIIESLKDDHVRMIAICGPGGVGKTTMVQRIVERVRNILFDEVVTVLVSQQIDKLKIQMEIAEMLRLHLTEATLVGRAHKIRTRLLDSKTKLVIFDDIWKSFDLNDIGVPLGNGSEGCKIILTSRLKDVCEEMDADKVVQVKVLDDQESWRLFRAKSGVREDDSELRPIAEGVAAECKGLPIALVPIAKALKKKHIRTWEDSLLQLKRSNPTNFPKVLEDVYKPLKLSYDFLKTESEKAIFLLCCLFPEDYDIPIELLTLYSIGLGILEGIRNIHEGRNRTHHLVERLKSSFLLIDGSQGDYVKMHDVVRDVAIFMGSKEKHGFLKSLPVPSMDSARLDSSFVCRWMSIDISNVNAEFPVGSAFPNLRLLMIPEPYYQFGIPRSEKINDDDIDFEGMEELNVFSFLRRNLGLFAPTLELLKKLKTLLLDNSDVREISVVGKLTNLEILRIRYCRSIEELPADIGRLNGLRLLELRGCEKLKRVAEGVISSLVRLEELKIVGGFDKWGAKVNGSEERNASLFELESLPNLTWLEINISDGDLVAQEICLSQQLVRYRILFTETGYVFDDMKYERNISLNLPGDIAVGNWIHQLVRNTQSLRLTGDGSNYINLSEMESLRKLIFTHCSTVELMVDGKIPDFFQNLEGLYVNDLPKLTHLWRSPNQNVSLRNLKTIMIAFCPNLRALFPRETARSLVQLQRLDIQNCGAIEQVFWNDIESNIEDEIVEFPRLTEIYIVTCPKLSTKMGKCPNLQSITLHVFNGLHHLPSSCCTRLWITQLRKLSVSDCDTIEELLVDDEIEDEGNHRHMIFPKLKVLTLTDLPRLTTFYRGVESIKFPKLENMKIINLPKMNELAPMDSEPALDNRCLHFFCNQKVEFSCLKELTIGKLQDTTNKIWCSLVPNNFFCKLERLTIYDVDGIRNLMSSSIAKNLVNLDDLCIESCQEMIEVVEDDKEISVTSLFPKLKSILISDLHKLKCFCPWKNALEFPSLWDVCIYGCPGMQTLTLGPLSAPHDFTLNIDGELVEEKDLNGGLGDHFTAESRKARREKREQGMRKINDENYRGI